MYSIHVSMIMYCHLQKFVFVVRYWQMSQSSGESSSESGPILDWALVDCHGDIEVCVR